MRRVPVILLSFVDTFNSSICSGAVFWFSKVVIMSELADPDASVLFGKGVGEEVIFLFSWLVNKKIAAATKRSKRERRNDFCLRMEFLEDSEGDKTTVS